MYHYARNKMRPENNWPLSIGTYILVIKTCKTEKMTPQLQRRVTQSVWGNIGAAPQRRQKLISMLFEECQIQLV